MEQLLEDYKRKLKTVIEMLNADTITPETIQRLTVKKGMIASFIVDIERTMAKADTGEKKCNKPVVRGSSFTLASEEHPITYETGAWDGKRSDVLILLLENGRYATGRLYSGFMDGSEFNDWYDDTDSEIELTNVEAWAVIPK